MIRIPYLDIELYIDNKYNIYNSEKNIIHTMDDGLHYSIKIRNKTKIKTLEWIYLFSNYYTDKFCLHPDRLLDVVFMDTYIIRGKIVPTIVPTSTIPITIINYGVIYRLLVAYPRYAISIDGILLDTYTGKIKKTNGNSKYYPTVSIYVTNTKQRLTIRLHRLVAMAWIENDNYLLKFIVNHIDGNKANYHATNLEWVSFAENNKHAIDTRLRTSSKVLIVRNIDTDEVYEFPSITDACKHIGRSNLTTTYVNVVDIGKIISGTNGRFEISYADSNNSMVSEKDKSLLISRNQKTRILVTYNKKTYIINNIDELRSFLDSNELNIIIPTTVNDKFREYGKRILDRINDLTYSIENLDSYSNNINYICRNILTGEETIYNNRRDIMMAISSSKSNIQKSIATNGAYVVNNHVIKKNDGLPFSKLATIKNNPKSIQVIDVKSNTSQIFTSIRKTAEYFKVDKKTISNAIENNRMINNKRIIYK